MGIFGSLHCIGMCGGLVAALSVSSKSIFWRGLILYQFGRVVTYMLLGLVAGASGMLLISFTGDWLQRGLALFAGIVMMIFALNLGGWLADPLSRMSLAVSRHLGLVQLVRSAAQQARSQSWMALGMANGLLPCGLVYAALAMAAATANVVDAVLMMAAFGLGTVPAMLLAPSVLAMLKPNQRAILLKFSAVLVLLLGVMMLMRGFNSHDMQHQHRVMEVSSGWQSVSGWHRPLTRLPSSLLPGI